MVLLKNIDFGILDLFETEDQAYEKIKEVLEEKKIKVYYYRSNFLEDGSIMIDYGSHTNFFYVIDLENQFE